MKFNKEIEELSLNHWQPLSTLLYDGWVLRFADGYTKRANSVNPIYYSTLPIHQKIEACEKMYTAKKLRPKFKITPFVQPENLDRILEEKGYSLIDLTSVQTMNLDRVKEPTLKTAVFNEEMSLDWFEHFCRLSKIGPENKQTMMKMLATIATRHCFISLKSGDQIAACGLGVIEREYIGLYDVVTAETFRNQGFGEQLILNLLNWGKENGARYSCLAVLVNNPPARRLYAKVGYTENYRYWYRVMDQ